jgi:hypothetical protein
MVLTLGSTHTWFLLGAVLSYASGSLSDIAHGGTAYFNASFTTSSIFGAAAVGVGTNTLLVGSTNVIWTHDTTSPALHVQAGASLTLANLTVFGAEPRLIPGSLGIRVVTLEKGAASFNMFDMHLAMGKTNTSSTGMVTAKEATDCNADLEQLVDGLCGGLPWASWSARVCLCRAA